MNKLTIASLVGAFLLTACSTTTTTEVSKDWPVYCIREATFLDNDAINGRVLLDMPGYPHGMNDEPMEVSRETYNNLEVDVCTSDDPRMK